MIGVYFSGTGNTKFCVEQFMLYYQGTSTCVSIEDETVYQKIKESEEFVFAYPCYYSNLSKIVSDFIIENPLLFKGKKIFIITTFAVFSGDGTGCAARLFKNYGATIIGGLHVKMPDCISDEKVLKRPLSHNKKIVMRAKRKIAIAAKQMLVGNPPQTGLSLGSHIAGLLGQRLWFYNQTKTYRDKLKIDESACIGCGLCGTVCPMKNITLLNKKITTAGKCIVCYRCVSQCPKQAITILGKKIYEQCRIDHYIDDV